MVLSVRQTRYKGDELDGNGTQLADIAKGLQHFVRQAGGNIDQCQDFLTMLFTTKGCRLLDCLCEVVMRFKALL